MKLVTAIPLDEGQRRRLTEISPGLEIHADGFLRTPEAVADLLVENTEILYAVRVPRDILTRAPGLKWLHLMSAGCDRLAGNPVLSSPVRITTSSGIHATPIAEYVLGVILALYRWLPQAYRGQLEKEWLGQDFFARGSRELRGKTVGIVGYGSIGREVARLAKPFGTRILALKRDASSPADTGYAPEGTGDREGTIPEKIFSSDQLGEMLPQCDVVVIAVPYVEKTHHLLGRAEFELMKPRSFLVNIARGAVLDEEALIAALKDGPMGGAALDVFETEPLPESSALWDMPNVILTPHISGASRPYRRRAFEILAENLRRYVAGETLLNLVDHDLGY